MSAREGLVGKGLRPSPPLGDPAAEMPLWVFGEGAMVWIERGGISAPIALIYKIECITKAFVVVRLADSDSREEFPHDTPARLYAGS